MRKMCVAMVVLALAAGVAGAQEEPQVMRYEANYVVKPGQDAVFTDLMTQHVKPIYDGLMSDGTLVAWGVATPVLHGHEPANHGVWWVVRDYAGVEKVLAAVEKMAQGLPPDVLQSFMTATDPSQHQDFLLRALVSRTRAVPYGSHPYISVSYLRTADGKGRDWLELWKKHTQPVLEQLLADGVIIGYGADVEEEHTSNPANRWTWIITPSLAAFDAVDAAFDKAHSADEWRAIGLQFQAVTVREEHRDFLYSSAMFTSQAMQ